MNNDREEAGKILQKTTRSCSLRITLLCVRRRALNRKLKNSARPSTYAVNEINLNAPGYCTTKCWTLHRITIFLRQLWCISDSGKEVD
jgi:hypothetical protein